MTRFSLSVFSMIVGMTCALSLVGCGRGPKTKSLSATEEPSQPVAPHVVTDTGSAGGVRSRDAVLVERINFRFDDPSLSPEAKARLAAKATVLRASPGIRLRVEGHADEQGSDAYNQALGMRRALSAKRFLVQKGVDAQRLHVISYGEKRPVERGHSEAAWSVNRRVDFTILTDPTRSGR
jgi:peptidoglycan-associated lipoprotein